MGVEQVGGAVQADGGLARTGSALDAQRGVEVRPYEHVLVRLDRRHDVAHRAGSGPLDLILQQPGGCLAGPGQILVLVRGQLSLTEAEPAPARHSHRLAGTRAVERERHSGSPVDHQRLAADLAGDVAAADVARLVELSSQGSVVVEPAEEQRNGRVILEGAHPAVQQLLEVLSRDRVATHGSQAGRLGAHPRERGTGLGEVVAFRRQNRVACHEQLLS